MDNFLLFDISKCLSDNNKYCVFNLSICHIKNNRYLCSYRTYLRTKIPYDPKYKHIKDVQLESFHVESQARVEGTDGRIVLKTDDSYIYKKLHDCVVIYFFIMIYVERH
jgi:hypothetical protein